LNHKKKIVTAFFADILNVPFAKVGMGETAFNFRARVGMERP
jgi:hypothetical protein